MRRRAGRHDDRVSVGSAEDEHLFAESLAERSAFWISDDEAWRQGVHCLLQNGLGTSGTEKNWNGTEPAQCSGDRQIARTRSHQYRDRITPLDTAAD